ncbi:MAG: hypothetical protein ACK5NT_00285, partial [Pyrinomonadaceae bacterium]
KYLDNYDAREWLRLEFQALRNCLDAIDHKKKKSEISQYLEDALRYRKLRQTKYKVFLEKELELETLEGLANYTGFKLSTMEDIYKSAIAEISQREGAQTYTRPFPYATGVAYGLIFDFLKIPWKSGLTHTYNFLQIYEQSKQKNILVTDEQVTKANARNNFAEIHSEESERKTDNDRNIAYYVDLLSTKPTLSVKLADRFNYGMTFNMNGTIELPSLGTVYSSISGRDISGKNFGTFRTLADHATLGDAGILITDDDYVFFPTPFKTDGNKIIGETYEIALNDGWMVEKADSKGNFVIKKKQ